jgi:hypothetical protein
LLVGVGVARDEASGFEFEAGEHGLGAMDELPGEERVEGFDGEGLPGGVLSGGGHRDKGNAWVAHEVGAGVM